MILFQPVIASARWWPRWCRKCVSGLRRQERNLNFLRCIQVFELLLTCCLDIIEGNWYNTLLLPCVGDYSCIVNWNDFFAIWTVGLFLDWSFRVLHFYWNVCNWIPKVIWTRLEYDFAVFWLECAPFRQLHIFKNCYLQGLLKYNSLLTTSNHFDK